MWLQDNLNNNKMKATEQLKEEHEGIKLMLSIIERFNMKAEAGEDVNVEHLESMINFIKTFADKCHHGKEEEVLFPAMVKAGMSYDNGPVAVMLIEHDQGRAYVKGLTEAFNAYKGGDKSALKGIIENSTGYINLLRSHIDKENNILFRMADQIIDPSLHDSIYEAFEKIELEKIGAGKHEEYHVLLKKLKAIYL